MRSAFFRALLLLTGVLIIASSCTRYGDDVVNSETDIIATAYNDNLDFGSIDRTFAIVDSIILIQDENEPPINEDAFYNLFNEPLLNKIIQNLESRGYTRVDQEDNPGLFINAVANATVFSQDVFYPGWWWGYPGYPCDPFYPWWCGGGGWYPGGVVTYSFTEGAMVIEMIDVNSSEDAGLPVVNWWAGLTRVLSNNTSTNLSRALENIDQAFEQSPYLD